jgi:hypothetical protein
MGIENQTLRFLLRSKGAVSYEKLLMLGRQGCYMKLDELRQMLRQAGLPSAEVHSALTTVQKTRFMEPVLKLLGAQEIESLDFSDYEQATIVHDLNHPIPDNLRERFSCVFDGGSLEHVFDFPRAIENAMEMVSVGGHFLGIGPVNNWPGHGFYQFSPELYWRIFSEPNGYEVEEMIVCETESDAPFYRVPDPEKTGLRVEFKNSRRTYLMVRARRLRRAELFKTPPQQSDYEAIWSRHTEPSPAPGSEKLAARIKRLLPLRVRAILRPLMPRALAPKVLRKLRACGFEEV